MILTDEPLIPCRSMEDRPIVYSEPNKRPIKTKGSENMYGDALAEEKEARKRAKQKAKSMFPSFSSSGTKGFSRTNSKGEKPSVARSQSADYGYGRLYCDPNNRGPKRRIRKRQGTASASRPRASRSQSDSNFYSSTSSCITYERWSSDHPSLPDARSTKTTTIPQGPDSFSSPKRYSGGEISAPKKPSRRQSIGDPALILQERNNAPRRPCRRQSIEKSSVALETDGEELSLISCPNIITVNQDSKAERFAPKMPSRRLSSKHKSSDSLFGDLDIGLVSIELEWPEPCPHVSPPSGCVEYLPPHTSSVAPRMPARRMSNHAGNVVEAVSLEMEEEKMELFMAPVQPQRSAAELLAMGHESFASIGREYIFEDPNRLVSSPQKSPRKDRRLCVAETFQLSGRFSISDDLSSISSTSAESEDSFASPNTCRSAI